MTPSSQPSPASRRCADRLVEVLADARVNRFYGVPGGAISPLYDALLDHPAAEVVHVRHESCAAFMGIGHHFVRPDELVCVLTTSGPGFTNALTGIASAYAERVPMVVIAGDVPRSKAGRGALQDGAAGAMDVVGMARSVCRFAERIEAPEHAAVQLHAAIARARRERGPVFLSLPLDVGLAPVPKMEIQLSALQPEPLEPRTILDVARLLADARQPLFVVGAGARPCAEPLRRLVHRLHIPVVTSPDGKGIIAESRPECLGVVGYGGHPSAHQWLAEHPPDVTVVLGCSMSEVATSSWTRSIQGTSAMVQFDEFAHGVGCNYRIDQAIIGAWHPLLAALDEQLSDVEPWTLSLPGIARIEVERELEGVSPLHPARVLRVLQDELPGDTLYAADVGENLLFAIHHLEVVEPGRFLCALETGSMGSGLNGGVGAIAADPKRTVVAIGGDYAFAMYGMEFQTCVQNRWPLVFVVMNDARMRMVEAGQMRIYGRAQDMAGPQNDLAAIARAMGGQGAVITCAEELRAALRDRPDDGPVLLDCRIDPTAAFAANARVADLGTFTED